ncbi:MAG: FliH/SctL family protein [bacterium]
MARIIKAPQVNPERPYRVVEPEKVMRHADDEAAEILQAARDQEAQILEEAERQAEGIIAEALQQAEDLLAQARRETETLKDQARKQGYQEGQNQAQTEGRNQISGLVRDFRQMMEEGQRILESLFRDQEPEIRELVSEIAGRVVQRIIAADDEVVVRVARECIHKAAGRKTIRVLVHPDDQKKVEEWAPEFLRVFDDIEKISIDTDPRVRKGGVIIESGTGGVDGRIDKQMEILDDALLNS